MNPKDKPLPERDPGIHIPRSTQESTLAFLRRENRRLQGLVDRRAKLDAEIIQILQAPASNMRMMAIANPARRVLNLLKQFQ